MQPDTSPLPNERADWIVKVNYQNRVSSFSLLFAIVTAHIYDQQAGAGVWALLTGVLLIYPHLAVWRARRSPNPNQAELENLLVDSFLLGLCSAALEFPVWIVFIMVIGTSINHMVYLGLRGGVRSTVTLILGALIAVTLTGLRWSPDTSGLTTVLCIIGLSLYLMSFANVAFLRTRKLREARQQLHQGQEQLHAANAALQQQLDEKRVLQALLQEQVNRDPLTGLYNRRYLSSTLEREIARCRREQQSLSLVMIDVDHFKQVNDTYGHPAGDDVLKQLASLLSQQARAGDVACRFGGEEFLIMLPNMPAEVALERAEQWRAAFEATTVRVGHLSIRATLSMGISCFPAHGDTPQILIDGADQALYQAKSQGRNGIVLWGGCAPDRLIQAPSPLNH
jgi:diguanylate cyclase